MGSGQWRRRVLDIDGATVGAERLPNQLPPTVTSTLPQNANTLWKPSVLSRLFLQWRTDITGAMRNGGRSRAAETSENKKPARFGDEFG